MGGNHGEDAVFTFAIRSSAAEAQAHIATLVENVIKEDSLDTAEEIMTAQNELLDQWKTSQQPFSSQECGSLTTMIHFTSSQKISLNLDQKEPYMTYQIFF